MSSLGFVIEAEAENSQARAGRFRTRHNEVKTPVFMPVGTHATVRGQYFETLESLDFPVLLANTYHLLLRPGPEVFKKLKGLHRLTDWKRSFLTDSGGFQIFSLPQSRKITEEGAVFRSYVNGDLINLTPERCMEFQGILGSDIAMVLDHCMKASATREESKHAMERTHRWALRSLEARAENTQGVFGIVQGTVFFDQRKQSADFLSQFPFDGLAIGGLGLGESKKKREDVVAFTTDRMPKNWPRYLMGVGTPSDILEAVHRGVDMFDCILPTALAQQGVVFTSKGRIDLKRGVHRLSEDVLDANCNCVACTRYTRAYLHHLVKVKEGLGWSLLSQHNLTFYATLMRDMRENLTEGTWDSFYKTKHEELQWVDVENPITHPPRKRKPNKSLGNFEIKELWTGHEGITHLPSGETMHSINVPDEESQRLYVDQSNLIERVQTPGDPLKVWDVGLGPGHNAMAAIRAVESICNGSQPPRRLEIYSFENDLDSIRLALQHKYIFKHLRHGAPERLLEKGEWEPEGLPLSWKLLEGDFREWYPKTPKPDLIFYDPYSYKTNGELWNLEVFSKIREFLGDHSTELFTYSASTAVRSLLLAAGFHVGKGLGSGPKEDTTVAMTPAAAKSSERTLLQADWLARWENSQAKHPEGNHLPIDQFEKRIRSHPQFAD